MSSKLRKSVTESILAIVCNIFRAHTVTRGCVPRMKSSRGKFSSFFFPPSPVESRALIVFVEGETGIFACTMHSCSSARKLLARLLEKGVERGRGRRALIINDVLSVVRCPADIGMSTEGRGGGEL